MIQAVQELRTRSARFGPPVGSLVGAVASALVRVPAWALLTLLVGLSTALRFWASRGIPVPWIAPDEMIYGMLGQNLYRAGRLAILDGPTAFYSLVYPALTGSLLGLDDLERGYALLKGLQALVMSLAAVPVYLWGRSLMSHPWALLATALTLAIPGLAYSGLVMSEVAFYPVSVLAFWALARALSRPTLGSQTVFVLAFTLAAATRLQAVVLLPILATAVVLKAAFDRRLAGTILLWPTFAGLGLVSFAWTAWRLAQGGPWNQVLGAYAAAGNSSYGITDALEYIAYHAGDLLLMTGLFPACALALVAIDAALGREGSEPARAFLAVSISSTIWLLVQVGTFASRHVDRLAERNLLPAAPLLFLALGLFLDRGAARPHLRTSVVAVAAAIPVLSLPVKNLINEGALPDAFSLVPFFRLLERDPGANIEVIVFGGATLVAALFVLLPPRFVVILPVALLAALAATSYAAGRYVAEQATRQRTQLVGPIRRWIDPAVVGRPTAYLYDGDFFWNEVWETVFWNRAVRSVYDLPGKHVPGPLPQSTIGVRGDGRVVLRDGRAAPERYVVASATFHFVGRPIWSIATPGTEQAGLLLWRLRPPFRMSTAQSGIRPNGEIRQDGRLVVYGCSRGTFHVTVVAVEPLRFELHRNGRLLSIINRPPYKFVRLRPGQAWSGSVPARPSGAPRRSTCTFEVLTSNLMYATRFEFARR